MPSISLPTAAVIGGGLTAAGGVASGLIGASASQNAAKTQADAATQAAQMNMQMYQQTRNDLTPFMSVGTGAISQLAHIFGLGGGAFAPSAGTGAVSPLASFGGAGGAGAMGGAGGLTDAQAAQLLQDRPDVMAEFQRASSTADRNSPAFTRNGLDSAANYARHWFGAMGGSNSYQIPGVNAPLAPTTGTAPASGAPGSSLSDLIQSFPGYQFGQQQGLQALDRSAAARGLDRSGGQLQDITKFGTDYAMQQGWAPYISELNTMASAGQNAAAGVGTQGTQLASQAGSGIIGAGNASAAGTVGAAQSYQGILQNSLQAYRMYGGGIGGGGGMSYNANDALTPIPEMTATNYIPN